jgi:hypothetical protein
LSAKEISKPLTHIFNLTFSTGIIPDNLKVALITVIMGNNAMKFENYRPTSVLVCFSKLLERLMINRLSKFIEKTAYYQNTSMDSEKIGEQNMQ